MVVLVASAVTIYPIHAQKVCSAQAKRHANYTQNGEIYLSIDRGSDKYPTNVKLSQFNELCMQDRFGL